MIKLYKIKIGDKVYEVELEAVSEKEGKIEATKPETIRTCSRCKCFSRAEGEGRRNIDST